MSGKGRRLTLVQLDPCRFDQHCVYRDFLLDERIELARDARNPHLIAIITLTARNTCMVEGHFWFRRPLASEQGIRFRQSRQILQVSDIVQIQRGCDATF
jgi:hypothetical protein